LLPQRRDDADTIDPLTADLRRFHITVDREFLELLETARDALSHSDPGATTNDAVEACLWRHLWLHQARRVRAQGRSRARRPRDRRQHRLLCRFHNQYEARLQFGDAFMDRFTRTRTPTSPPTEEQRSFTSGSP
jgi:hypothetical protein